MTPLMSWVAVGGAFLVIAVALALDWWSRTDGWRDLSKLHDDERGEW